MMVKKKVDRKATAALSVHETSGIFENNVGHSSNRRSPDDVSVISVLQYMTRDQLKGLLRKRGLSISGKRANMINRLRSTMSENTSTIRRTKDLTTANGTQSSTKGKPVETQTVNNSFGDSGIDPECLTLWQHPLTTLSYFLQELFINIVTLGKKISSYRRIVWIAVLVIVLFVASSRISGPQQEIFKAWETRILWWLYWIGLGVLSSVGLGTGLHTFVLYLGPHIATVTMAAYECGTLDFPEPPYPDEIICPDVADPLWAAGILNIMRKVRVEAMLWGAGTALGELPPYFMARAARTSGKNNKNEDFDQEDLKELEALEALENGQDVSVIMRIKLGMKHFVQKAGFWGILACASIPNPLFDLAGLTCGHYLIPFWTFFGATLIGKAVVKMHIQQLAVIIAFNEELLDKFIKLLAIVPYVGTQFQTPLKKYLVEQKEKLHHKRATDSRTTISWLFDNFVILMVCYFLVTIIHALARNHHRRRTKVSTD